jgi:hypothetical protein
VCTGSKRPAASVAIFALITGFAVWIWQPALVALPLLLVIMLLRRPALLRFRWMPILLVPVLLGLAPPVLYNAQNDWPTLSSLVRKAGEAQPASGTSALDQVGAVGSLLFLALGGGDDSVGGASLVEGMLLTAGLVLVPVACVFAALRCATASRRQRAVGVSLVMLGAVLHVGAAYEVTRYFVPAIAAACVMFGVGLAALAGRFRIVGSFGAVAVVAVLVVTNLGLYPRTAELLGGPDLASLDATQTALAALQARDLQMGYADYWTAYPLTYVSGERIIVAPDLPFFWRARTDRYPPYSWQVDAVTDPTHLFALVDGRCALSPILAPLDASGATYQLEPVARWTLIWGLHVPVERTAAMLAAWRSAIQAASC